MSASSPSHQPHCTRAREREGHMASTSSHQLSHACTHIRTLSARERHHITPATRLASSRPERSLSRPAAKPSPPTGNFSVIRAFRALRPLRALKRVPGMPVLVESILAALPRVGNVLLLMAFLMLVFAIVGVELFKGLLHYRCALPGFVESNGHPAGGLGGGGGGHRALAGAVDQSVYDTEVACDPTGASSTCLDGTSCMYFDESPGHGLMSFDNVGVAAVVLLQALTFDDWTEPMYSLIAAFSPWASVYFLLIVILGGFFVVNLFLAVIFEELEGAGAAASPTHLQPSQTPLQLISNHLKLLSNSSPTINLPRSEHPHTPSSHRTRRGV